MVDKKIGCLHACTLQNYLHVQLGLVVFRRKRKKDIFETITAPEEKQISLISSQIETWNDSSALSTISAQSISFQLMGIKLLEKLDKWSLSNHEQIASEHYLVVKVCIYV